MEEGNNACLTVSAAWDFCKIENCCVLLGGFREWLVNEYDAEISADFSYTYWCVIRCAKFVNIIQLFEINHEV